VSEKQRPADLILDAAFEGILTPTLRRLLDRKTGVALVVIVPTAAWVAPLQSYLKRRLGDRWHVIARDGSLLRTEHKSSSGNSTVSGLLANGQPVVGIAASPDILPRTLISSADHTINIPAPTSAILQRAIESHLGRGIAKGLPTGIGTGLDIHDLTAAFRPGSTARQITDRIARATQQRIGSRDDDRLPPLETAFEYGDARLWAMDLATDMAEYRAGRLKWSQVSRGARVVLHGETGTGKTLLARMVARHLGLQLLAFSIADLFKSEGALGDVVQATNAMFESAASASPCVALLDEADALPDRATISARGRDWWLPVITNFMVKLDGALARDRHDGCVFIACTNYLNRIDSALLRPGRFERSIEIRRPNLAGTVNILAHYMPELTETDRADLGRLLEGSTGAELMAVARDARRIARHDGRALRAEDVRAVALPNEEIPPERLRRICIHEAAHAVATLALECGTLRGIVVKTRDGAAAQTMTTHDETDLPTRRTFEFKVVVTLCGRAAETLLVGEASVGSGLDHTSDLAIATRMIASLHASAGLGGHLTFTSTHEDALKAVACDKDLRRRVERHLGELDEKAKRLVKRHRRAILAVADALAEARYLSGGAIQKIVDECRDARSGVKKVQHSTKRRTS
jgi:cell division protease FtsH